jgi:DNA-binding IclR family transcriptional regulator
VDAAAEGTVPAVERAIATLRHLEENIDSPNGTVTVIARTLGLNKSTCSYVLRTLNAGGFVQYDQDSKQYSLGPALIGLGSRAGRGRHFNAVVGPHLQALARATTFTCVAFEQLPNGEFMVVAKAESPREIKATIDLGQRTPPNAPGFSRIALAWSSAEEVREFLETQGLVRFTPLTQTDPEKLPEELERVRQDGYCIADGEYLFTNTAICAPVFSPSHDICRGISLIAFRSEIAEEDVHHYAATVRDAANAISREL